MTWATEAHPAPEHPANPTGEAEFQEMSLHVRELSRLLSEKEAALHAVYARTDLARRTSNGPSAIGLALVACVLIAVTLIAWNANDQPVDAQSRLWYLPLTLAGGLFAAALVAALQPHHRD
jgi:hypothetical protein